MPFEENRRVSGFLHPNVGKTVRIRAFSSSLTGSIDGNMQKGKIIIIIIIIINKGRRSTISEMAGRLGLLYGTCQRIPREELNTLRISAKFMPWWLEKAAIFSRYKHGCIFHTRVI